MDTSIKTQRGGPGPLEGRALERGPWGEGALERGGPRALERGALERGPWGAPFTALSALHLV